MKYNLKPLYNKLKQGNASTTSSDELIYLSEGLYMNSNGEILDEEETYII